MWITSAALDQKPTGLDDVLVIPDEYPSAASTGEIS
jgi:hypothetical protein